MNISDIQDNLKSVVLLWEYVYDIISNSFHMFTIPDNTFLESPIDD